METTFDTDRFNELTRGIEYEASFVPYSQSRNAGKWESLNWRVSIKRGPIEMVTDYSQGIGCLSDRDRSTFRACYGRDFSISHGHSNDSHSAKMEVLESGKLWKSHNRIVGKPIDPPELRDVLYSLVSDSDVIDYQTFEDWAQSMGYDADSRSAEATYRACLENALRLRGMFGDDALQQLRELFQDY